MKADDSTSVEARRPPSVLVTIRSLLPNLAPAERRVAEAALNDPPGTASSTISELARQCSTSETTVLRFCRAIGLDGYPALRLALAAAGAQATASQHYASGQILPGASVEEVVQAVSSADMQAVSETAAQLDHSVVELVAKALYEAPRIDIYGVGASGYVAQDFQQKLHRIGRVAFAWTDPHAARASAALLGPNDVALAMSHTGTTADTIEWLAQARAAGARTVAITNYPRSPITAEAELVITTAARETTFRSGAMASRIAQLTLVDILFVLVAQEDLDRTMDALQRTYEAIRQRRLD